MSIPRPDLIFIPYGSKKGKQIPIWKIPSKMLKWMAENYRNDRIASLADSEWQYRQKYNTHLKEWEN
ncbi:MAG: hypothetical protein KAS39_01800 [Actinomycetia bacterium]|nr:hypothetical protein [Actinomycetes bacterium]